MIVDDELDITFTFKMILEENGFNKQVDTYNEPGCDDWEDCFIWLLDLTTTWDDPQSVPEDSAPCNNNKCKL